MATLAIIFKGQDEIGAASKQVASDIKDVGESADKASPKGSGFFSGMLQAASGFLLANVVGAIGSQLGDLASSAMEDARGTQQLMAQTETIIKNTGGAAGMSAQQVADLAASLSDAAGQSLFGDDQIQGAENVLLKYKELKGIIPGVTTLAVDMAQSLGKDPAAAAEFLGRALQKPFDAAAKLAKEGIVLNDSQKATLDAFKKTGDTAGAQAFLIEQLNSTYKGSAAAAAGAAGGTVQFKARMGEAAETVATAFLPILDQAGKLLNDYLAPAIETVATWLGNNLPGAVATASDFFSSTLMPAISTISGFLAGRLIPIVSDLNAWLSQTLPPAIQQLSDYWTQTLQPALQMVWAFIDENVIPIIDTLVGVAFAILKEDIKILAALWVNVLWPALQKVWAFLDAFVIPILARLIVWLKDNLPPAIRFLADLWNNVLLPALSAVWSFISTKVLPILNAIGEVINAVLVVAFKLIAGFITTTLVPAFVKLWDYIDKNVLPILRKIGDVISTIAGPAISALGTLIKPVVGFFSDLMDNVQGVVQWLEELAAKIKSIHIPSWAGGDGGGGGGGESAPPPTGQSLTRTTTSGFRTATPGALGSSGVQRVVISFDDAGSELLRKLIRVEINGVLASSGARTLSRIRLGG